MVDPLRVGADAWPLIVGRGIVDLRQGEGDLDQLLAVGCAHDVLRAFCFFVAVGLPSANCGRFSAGSGVWYSATSAGDMHRLRAYSTTLLFLVAQRSTPIDGCSCGFFTSRSKASSKNCIFPRCSGSSSATLSSKATRALRARL